MNNIKNINTPFVLLVTFLSFISIYSTKLYLISLILAAIEYLIVYYFIVKGKVYQSFLTYVLFLSTTIERDDMVYYDGVIPFERYSIFNPGLLFRVTGILIFIQAYCQYKGLPFINKDIHRFKKWVYLLLTTGLLSMFITIVLDDHSIISKGRSFNAYFSVVMGFISLISLIFTALILCKEKKSKERLSNALICILMGVSLSTIISILLGYEGYYGTEYKTMLAPLLAGFCPCLLLFTRGRSIGESIILYAIVAFVMILAFKYPTPIGSKWYLVIGFSVVCLVYSYLPRKNIGVFILMLIFALTAIPLISESLSSLMATDDFNNWKFNQAMGALDILSAPSIEYWFLGLDESARFRFDEPINIAIEYINEPIYAFLGKGFSGTTLHYTKFCDWDVSSAFVSIEQQLGAYSTMHETFAVVFLRHGLLGVVFFVDVLIMLSRKIKNSPFAVWAIIWFFFYWAYGNSFRLGAVACVIALASETIVSSKSEIQSNGNN